MQHGSGDPLHTLQDIILYASDVYISIRCGLKADQCQDMIHPPGSRPSSCARLEREEKQLKKKSSHSDPCYFHKQMKLLL